ncbi:MAG: DUF1990 family protein [Taibaiella sp.]|nr:DUF1990 family protein [Taibaiella sp.]
MLIYLNDQSAKLCKHLQKFQLLPVIPYNIGQLKEKKASISITCNEELKELSLNFLFDYLVFPDNILTACTQWAYEQRNMQTGDIIVQQIYFPPFKIISQKIVAGVRIKEIFKEDRLMGFSYETLQGHIEKGISSFLISKTNGYINFAIHTHSKPNNVILDLLSPLFSSPYQDYCTRKALQQMKELFKKENSIA